MDAIWLVIGLFAGAALAWLVMRSRLQHELALARERLAAVTESQERMSIAFKALSAEALQANMAQLAELA